MNSETQRKLVLNYLRRNNTITQQQSDDDLGISRLAARIHELKKTMNIDKCMITVLNRRGERCKVAEYFLDEPEQMQLI